MADPFFKDLRLEMLDLGLHGGHVQLLLLFLILHPLSLPKFGQSSCLAKQVFYFHGMDIHLPLLELFLQLMGGRLVRVQFVLERFLPILQDKLGAFQLSGIIFAPLLKLRDADVELLDMIGLRLHHG
jgi:hypothetical protein